MERVSRHSLKLRREEGNRTLARFRPSTRERAEKQTYGNLGFIRCISERIRINGRCPSKALRDRVDGDAALTVRIREKTACRVGLECWRCCLMSVTQHCSTPRRSGWS